MDRPSSLPPQGRTTLRTRRDHHHLLLGRLPAAACLYLVVVQEGEQAEGSHPGVAGLRESGESSVSSSLPVLLECVH
jgi:hypothetical protein